MVPPLNNFVHFDSKQLNNGLRLWRENIFSLKLKQSLQKFVIFLLLLNKSRFCGVFRRYVGSLEVEDFFVDQNCLLLLTLLVFVILVELRMVFALYELLEIVVTDSELTISGASPRVKKAVRINHSSHLDAFSHSMV